MPVPKIAGAEADHRLLAHTLTALALAGGLALGVLLLAHYGAREVLDLLARAGWGLLPVAGVHVVQLVFTGLAWRDVTRRDAPLSVSEFVVLRWLREGINNLLSVLAVGGIVASVRVLVQRGLSVADALASVATDMSVELITQVGFTLLGLLLLVAAQGVSALSWWMGAGIAVLCVAAALLLPARWPGLSHLAEFTARRLGWSERVGGLHEAILALYRDRIRFGSSAAWHMVAWLLGAIEVWLVLHLLGADATLLEALVIESLGLAVKGAAFVVPGALGVQEGGFIVVCGLFGFSPETGLALSLAKRLRDVIFGVPSLALWLSLERQRGPGLRHAPRNFPA
jgi:putative membrane protein